MGERADGNFESVDKLYLLSYREVFGARHQNDTASGPEHTRQLDYYLNLEVTQSEYQHAIKQFNDDNSCWWLRSALSYKNHRFHYVCPDKVGDSYYAINESGVSLAFRIG